MPDDAAVLPSKHLIRARSADLIGPFRSLAAAGGTSEDVLPIPPPRCCLSGFLAPQEVCAGRATMPAEILWAGLAENGRESARQNGLEPKRKHHQPASIGISVLLGQKTTILASRQGLALRMRVSTPDPLLGIVSFQGNPIGSEAARGLGARERRYEKHREGK